MSAVELKDEFLSCIEAESMSALVLFISNNVGVWGFCSLFTPTEGFSENVKRNMDPSPSLTVHWYLSRAIKHHFNDLCKWCDFPPRRPRTNSWTSFSLSAIIFQLSMEAFTALDFTRVVGLIIYAFLEHDSKVLVPEVLNELLVLLHGTSPNS